MSFSEAATPTKCASALTRPWWPLSGAKDAPPCWLRRARAAAATCTSEYWSKRLRFTTICSSDTSPRFHVTR
eukprot:4883510-Alexandrium_andersonii.AAC.1